MVDMLGKYIRQIYEGFQLSWGNKVEICSFEIYLVTLLALYLIRLNLFDSYILQWISQPRQNNYNNNDVSLAKGFG